MKKITQALWVVITLLMSKTQIFAQQQVWVKDVEVEKRFTTGGYIFSFVRHMDKKNSTKSLAQYGYTDRTKQFDPYGKQIVQISTDSNSVKRVNGVLQSAGKMNFTSSHSAIYFHDTILGKEYVGVGKDDSIGLFSASFLVLNITTNTYVPVANLRFGSSVNGFLYLGNNKTLIFGVFYQASDGVTTQVYNGMAIWDMGTNLLSYVPGNVNFGGYGSHSSGKDGSTTIIYGGLSRLCFISSGIIDWDGLLLPKNPVGGRMLNVCTINKDTVYGVWQKDSTGHPCYLLKFIRSQGISWQQCARLTSTKTTVDVRNTWVNSIDYLNGKLRISTEATHCNGQLLGNNVFDVDPSTGVITNLPIPPIAGTDFGTSRMTVVDGKTYLLSDLDLVLGTQTIYVLRDTTARLAPVITSPTGTQLSAGVTVAGTVPEPLLSIDVYNKGTGVKVGSTVASSTGTWTLPLSLAEGIYSFQAKARNEDSILSPFSNTLSFSVDTCAGSLTTTVSVAEGQTVSSPVTFAGNTTEAKSRVVIRFRSSTPDTVDVTTSSHSWSLTKTRASGSDTAYISIIDSVGHTTATLMRTFIVSAVTAVVDPLIPSSTREPVLFPNPTRDFFVIKNAKSITRIVSIGGVLQQYRTSVTNDGLYVYVSSFSPGLYVVECVGKDKKQYIKKVIVIK